MSLAGKERREAIHAIVIRTWRLWRLNRVLQGIFLQVSKKVLRGGRCCVAVDSHTLAWLFLLMGAGAACGKSDDTEVILHVFLAGEAIHAIFAGWSQEVAVGGHGDGLQVEGSVGFPFDWTRWKGSERDGKSMAVVAAQESLI